jgi:hypothetical protein
MNSELTQNDESYFTNVRYVKYLNILKITKELRFSVYTCTSIEVVAIRVGSMQKQCRKIFTSILRFSGAL